MIDNETQFIRLGDLGNAVTVSRGVPTQATNANGPLPVFSVPDLRSGAAPKRFVEPAALSGIASGGVLGEDVLIALEGGSAGEVFVVPEDIPEFAPSQQVAVVRIHDHVTMDPWYLGAFLSTEPARMQMRRLTRGQKVQRIPLRDLDTVSVPLAPRSTQQAIGDQYRTFQAAIRVHRDTAQHLEDMCAAASELSFVP